MGSTLDSLAAVTNGNGMYSHPLAAAGNTGRGDARDTLVEVAHEVSTLRNPRSRAEVAMGAISAWTMTAQAWMIPGTIARSSVGVVYRVPIERSKTTQWVIAADGVRWRGRPFAPPVDETGVVIP